MTKRAFQRITGSPQHRYLARVVRRNGCWDWNGAKSAAGYGQLRVDGDLIYVHRLSWELHFGEIPSGMQVLHACDNPPCSRPDHLFLGTQSDNMRDKVAKGRDHESTKTHCKHGHPYDEANTIYRKSGRRCRTCKNDSYKRWYNARAQK